MPKATDSNMDFKNWYDIRTIKDEMKEGNPYTEFETRFVIQGLCQALMDIYTKLDAPIHIGG